MKNDLLRRMEAHDAVIRQSTFETAEQLIIDCISIALNDPEVMGKNAFGEDRIRPIIKAAMQKRDFWIDAVNPGPEADYMREKLDQRLQRIFRKEFDPFEARYKWVEKVQTVKDRRKK